MIEIKIVKLSNRFYIKIVCEDNFIVLPKPYGSRIEALVYVKTLKLLRPYFD